MARLRKYASRDRLGDPQVIDKGAFFDPNRQNLHQKDDYPDLDVPEFCCPETQFCVESEGVSVRRARRLGDLRNCRSKALGYHVTSKAERSDA